MEIKTIEHEYTIVLYPSAASDDDDDIDVPDTIIWDFDGGDIYDATGFEELQTRSDDAEVRSGDDVDDTPHLIWHIDTSL